MAERIKINGVFNWLDLTPENVLMLYKYKDFEFHNQGAQIFTR